MEHLSLKTAQQDPFASMHDNLLFSSCFKAPIIHYEHAFSKIDLMKFKLNLSHFVDKIMVVLYFVSTKFNVSYVTVSELIKNRQTDIRFLYGISVYASAK